MPAYKLIPPAVLRIDLPTLRTKPESYRLDGPLSGREPPPVNSNSIRSRSASVRIWMMHRECFYFERSHIICRTSETSTEGLRNVRGRLRLVFICRSIFDCILRSRIQRFSPLRLFLPIHLVLNEPLAFPRIA